MPNTQEDYQRVYKLFQMLCQMLGFGKDITEALITKYQRDYQEERGLRSIINFISHGGKAEQVAVNEEQADLFRQRLQERHVSYYETIITRDDNTKQHMFMYKGVSVQNGKEIPTPDKLQVAQIKKMFELELSCNAKELDVHTFKSLMTDKQIGIADNLTIEQVYAFRQNVKNSDIKFCVLQDKDDKYKVYANDTAKLTSVLAKMSYDLANDEEGMFRQAAEKYAAKKHDFYDKCGTEPFIICDKKNPNNFIYVGQHNYSIHSFQKEAELQPDGTTKDIIRDVAKPQVFDMDKEKLFEQTKQIANPILVPVAQFMLLSSVNKNGVAFANQEAMENYIDFKELHKEDELLIDKYPMKKPKYSEQNLDGYVQLPMSIVQQIKRDLPYVHTNDTDSIAFEKTMKPAVDAYLQKNVFETISDPMQSLAFRWKIEGRTGNFNPQLTGKVDTEFYILNPDNDKIAVGIDPVGIHIYRDGQEPEHHTASDPDYNEYLAQYVSADVLPNPVVLTLEEMQSEEKNTLISERANHFHENPAIQYMVEFEDREKEEIVKNLDHIHEIELSPEQEKAVNHLEKMHVHSKELDSAIFVEMQDLSINKEVSKDTEMDL